MVNHKHKRFAAVMMGITIPVFYEMLLLLLPLLQNTR